MKRILDYDHNEARRYFLKEESYFNFDLPQYFVFQKVLEEVSKKISGKHLSDFYGSYVDQNEKTKPTYPCHFEEVNFKFLNNKDGKFAWRPFQLIHPALYVSLVHKITEENNWLLIVEKFKEFCVNGKSKCHSIPIESDNELSDKAIAVSDWWQSIEQQSIELALNYEYVLHTDIADCYGSIYTHSIPWALHTKAVAKNNQKDYSLIGNVIDKHLRDMSFGQTNGIPQGSVLMDFIAEMVLGFADMELSEKIKLAKIEDYYIIRYRDDYRIFSNNPQDAELITKLLTETLFELGMRLNTQKTLVSNNVVRDSLKADKLYWMLSKKSASSLQEHLLIIHDLSQKFPNSGSLSKALTKFFKRISSVGETNQNIQVLISILVDIAYKNPRTYPISLAILSKLLSLINEVETIEKVLNSIASKFSKIPNTGYLKIWLQRVTIKIDRQKEYEETLCKRVNDNTIEVWNSNWLNEDLKDLINSVEIIDEEIIEQLNSVIETTEVDLFQKKSSYAELQEY